MRDRSRIGALAGQCWMGQKRVKMGRAVGLDGGAVVSDAQDVGSLAGHEAQLFELTA
jgi:hypothetical protein